jgi:Flp pilus assembly protein TadB
MLTKRRLLFLCWFCGALAALAVAGSPSLLFWPTIVILAAYVANWGVALAANKLPKKYVSGLDYRAVLITGNFKLVLVFL